MNERKIYMNNSQYQNQNPALELQHQEGFIFASRRHHHHSYDIHDNHNYNRDHSNVSFLCSLRFGDIII